MLKNATLIKRGWRTIGGRKIYFRSKWEYAYAQALELMKQTGIILDWEHEPKTFWFDKIKRGCRSYCPDFIVVDSDGATWWAEVKGYMDPRSATKLKRFKKYYPKETLYIIDGKWFKKNKIFLKDWLHEESNSKKENEKGFD